MNVIDFLKTIYIGDRGCKSITIDGWNAEIKLQVTSISRVRSTSWDYYSAEDLQDGFIVFEGASSVEFDPPGRIPNDTINAIEAQEIGGGSAAYLLMISADSVDSVGDRIEVKIRIHASGMALEDPGKPGERIRE